MSVCRSSQRASLISFDRPALCFGMTRNCSKWLSCSGLIRRRCLDGGFCRRAPFDSECGRCRRPVVNVASPEVEQVLVRLGEVSGLTYRGMTDAKWVHIVNIGSAEPAARENAHFDADHPLWVERSRPNAAGLYDLSGMCRKMTSAWKVPDDEDPKECFISRSSRG